MTAGIKSAAIDHQKAIVTMLAVFVADVAQKVVVLVGPDELAGVFVFVLVIMAKKDRLEIADVLDVELAIILVAKLEIDALGVGMADLFDLKTLVISEFPAVDFDDARAGDAGDAERQATDAKTN